MLAWAPGVGLDVDVLGAREELERTLLGEPLGDVDELAAAVVALAGQALGVLVRQPAALRLEDRRVDVVLAGDELDLVVLAAALADHRRPQLGVDSRRSGPRRVPWERWRSSAVPRSASLGRRRPVGRRRVRGSCPGSAAAGAHGPTTIEPSRRGQNAARDQSPERVLDPRLVEDRREGIGRDRPGAQDPRRTARSSRRPSRRRHLAAGPPSRTMARSGVAELADDLGGRGRRRLARPVGRDHGQRARRPPPALAGRRGRATGVPIVAAPPVSSGGKPRRLAAARRA